MQPRDGNQRVYYRVECPVVISHCVVGDRVPAGKPAGAFFPDEEHFHLLRELSKMDHDSSQLLHLLGEQDRNLGAYLNHVNRKIDTLARHIATLTPGMSQGSEQSISLSEGGLSFRCPQPPPRDSVLAVRLTLLPSYVGIAVYGRVVSTAPDPTDKPVVAINFEQLPDADRHIIARHVMKVQMTQKRNQGTDD